MAAFRGMHVSPRKLAMRDYKESVTTRQTDRQTPDKVIPMCGYASQATQKVQPQIMRYSDKLKLQQIGEEMGTCTIRSQIQIKEMVVTFRM